MVEQQIGRRQTFRHEGQTVVIGNKRSGGIGLFVDSRTLGKLEREGNRYKFIPENGAEPVFVRATSFRAAALAILGGADA